LADRWNKRYPFLSPGISGIAVNPLESDKSRYVNFPAYWKAIRAGFCHRMEQRNPEFCSPLAYPDRYVGMPSLIELCIDGMLPKTFFEDKNNLAGVIIIAIRFAKEI
jgi:hypothetical protein